MANAALALQFSDQIEGVLGVKSTAEEQARLRESMPKIVAVERGER